MNDSLDISFKKALKKTAKLEEVLAPDIMLIMKSFVFNMCPTSSRDSL